MDSKFWLITCGLIGCSLKGISAALNTNWTTPAIEGRNGTGTLTLAEDASTMPTLDITDATSYTIVSQTPAAKWDIANSGALSLMSGVTLDYETTTYYMLVVMASDGTDNAYATINITITDKNDNPPVIAQSTGYICLANAAAASTAVATLTTTDVDTTTTENVISAWTIKASSDTNTDFQISSSGVITTAKVTNMTARAAYALVIEAADSDPGTKLTGTASVFVIVSSTCTCSSAVAITASLITLLSSLLAILY